MTFKLTLLRNNNVDKLINSKQAGNCKVVFDKLLRKIQKITPNLQRAFLPGQLKSNGIVSYE